MPTHAEQRFLPYAPEKLYDLVADIERYPEFLPWCVGARVLRREDRVIYAEHVQEPKAAMDLLARHLVDQQASNDLFGTSTRLQQDLMSDGAEEYLVDLLPE